MKLTRRNLLRTSLALSILPGATSSAATHSNIWQETTDILVVGAGGSGLMAAVRAKELNPTTKVLVIEKAVSPFLNNTSQSTGIFNAAGSSLQKNNGSKADDIQRFKSDLTKLANHTDDEILTKVYAENSGKAIDWLSNHGVQYKLAASSAYSKPTSHACDKSTGSQYTKILVEEAKKLGVEIWTNTKAEELVVDQAGVVLGVKAFRGNNTVMIKANTAVLLATGGFAGNPELIDKHLVNYKGAYTCSSPNSTGDGLLMATKIGAGTTHLGLVGVYSYGVPVNPNSRRGLIFRGHILNLTGSITVGPDGKRFIADEAQQNDVTNAMTYHKFDKAFIIATQEQIDEFMKQGSQVIGWSKEAFLKELEENKVFAKKASSIAELAHKLGINAKNLENTIKRYNSFVEKGKDEDFSRKNLKSAFLKGPFYGFEGLPLTVETTGGLKVNHQLQVLDVYGKPIKKLYATGAVLGGGHGTGYVGGNPVGIAMTTGYYAGQVLSKK